MAYTNQFLGVEDQFGTKKTTEDEVWEFMMKYQTEREKPPTMEEIKEHCYALNFRSSARETLLSLHSKGLVKIEGEEGTSRRHIAIEYDSTLDVRKKSYLPDDMFEGGFWG